MTRFDDDLQYILTDAYVKASEHILRDRKSLLTRINQGLLESPEKRQEFLEEIIKIISVSHLQSSFENEFGNKEEYARFMHLFRMIMQDKIDTVKEQFTLRFFLYTVNKIITPSILPKKTKK